MTYFPPIIQLSHIDLNVWKNLTIWGFCYYNLVIADCQVYSDIINYNVILAATFIMKLMNVVLS